MRPGHGLAAALASAVIVVWLVLMGVSLRAAALPPEATGTLLAIFPVGHGDRQMFDSIIRAGGRPVRSTWLGVGWIAHGEEAGFVARLRAEGAVGAFSRIPLGPSMGGCSAVISLDRFLREAGLAD